MNEETTILDSKEDAIKKTTESNLKNDNELAFNIPISPRYKELLIAADIGGETLVKIAVKKQISDIIKHTKDCLDLIDVNSSGLNRLAEIVEAKDKESFNYGVGSACFVINELIKTLQNDGGEIIEKLTSDTIEMHKLQNETEESTH